MGHNIRNVRYQSVISPVGRPSVLVVSPREETRSKLVKFLSQGQWTVVEATGISEAAELLEQHTISVIIAEGSWRPILERVCAFAEVPSVVVTAPFADEALWAEVLNTGGYDVMSQPFDREEVVRITSAAMRRATMLGSNPVPLSTAATN